MSVINQMLKDLEENKQKTVQMAPVASIAPSHSSKFVMIFMMLLVTGLAAVAVYLFAERLQREDAVLVSPAVTVISPQDLSVKPASQPDLYQQPLKAEETRDESTVGAANMIVAVAAPTSITTAQVSETPVPLSKKSVSAVTLQPSVSVAKAPKTREQPGKIPAAKVTIRTVPTDVTVDADNSFAIKPVLRSRKEQAARYYKAANDALLTGDTLKAKQLLVKILHLDKHHVQAREKLASLLYGEKRYGDTVKVLQQGLANSPDYPNFRLMLARLYLQNNDKQQAYYYLKPLKPAVKENLDYYAMLAGLAQSLGDLEQAKAAYLQLTKYDVNRAKWWLGLGISADKLQQQPLALSAYKQAQSMGQLSSASRRYINDRINQLEKY